MVLFFFPTIIQGLRVSQVKYIFMNLGKSSRVSEFPVALFLFSLFVLPCSLSDGVTLCFRPPMRLKLDKRKPPKTNRKKNKCNCQNGIRNSTALTTCPSIESIFFLCENNRDPTSHVSWFQIRRCCKQRNF